MNINKTPGIKKAVLVSRPSNWRHFKLKILFKMPIYKAKRDLYSKNKNVPNNRTALTERLWKENKIYLLPIMPTDLDEREVFLEKEYHCSYCDQLYDDQTLECKVCFRVAHIVCLFRRGHLDSTTVSQKTDWSCADCVGI